MLTLVDDVARQASEPEGQFAAEIEEGANQGDKSAQEQQGSAEFAQGVHHAAARRWIKSFCSAIDSAPIVNASSSPRPSANFNASSCRLRSAPWPRIFMPQCPSPQRAF